LKFNFSSKILKNPLEILSKIPDGSKILVGGFGLCGIPENSIRYLSELGTKNLIVASNNCGKYFL
jgi:3-oxoacid CoA-transferase